MNAIAFAQRVAENADGYLRTLTILENRYPDASRDWFTFCRNCKKVAHIGDEKAAQHAAANHACRPTTQPEQLERETRPHGRWTAAEDAIIAQHTDTQAALRLPGRTVASVAGRRLRLRAKGRKAA